MLRKASPRWPMTDSQGVTLMCGAVEDRYEDGSLKIRLVAADEDGSDLDLGDITVPAPTKTGPRHAFVDTRADPRLPDWLASHGIADMTSEYHETNDAKCPLMAFATDEWKES